MIMSTCCSSGACLIKENELIENKQRFILQITTALPDLPLEELKSYADFIWDEYKLPVKPKQTKQFKVAVTVFEADEDLC